MASTVLQCESRYLRLLRLFSSLFVVTCGVVSCAERATISSSSVRGNKSVTQAAEILWISGCARPPARERVRGTLSCFADERSRHPIELVVRGRGFPLDGELSIVLEEQPPIPRSGGEDENDGGDGDLIVMECGKVTASRIFPRQILRCILPHPLDSLGNRSTSLQRLFLRSIWMNLKLLHTVTNVSSGERTVATIGIFSGAVQVDLRAHQGAPGAGAGGSDEEDEDPLEAMFRRANKTTMNDEWVSLGIGGLSDQLQELFRRVFLSRMKHVRDVAESLNLSPVRGVLLHGPPGTGKTLIARAIARLSGKKTMVTVVNAAHIVSKYVGESEKNLQDIFDAHHVEDGDSWEGEQPLGDFWHGRDAAVDGTSDVLHIVIMDEIDALFKQRSDGKGEGSQQVYDGLTNQFLTIMDGVDRVRNVLVIGLTNRLHVIDRALLRPGRLEVVIEIPLPDTKGRKEMFFIHTKQLRAKDFLASDVSLDLLAERTDGFSGADVAGTVRAAVSHAMVRYRDALITELGDEASADVSPSETVDGFKVTNDDFQLALNDLWELKSQVSSEDVGGGPGKSLSSNTDRLVDFDGTVSRGTDVVRHVMRSLQRSSMTDAAVVVIYGLPGTGKTVFSEHLVNSVQCGIAKFLSCRDPGGNAGRCTELVVDTLREAKTVKSNYCVVIDNIDRYVHSGAPGTAETLKSAINEFHLATESLPFRSGISRMKNPHGKRLLITTTSDKELFQGPLSSVGYDVKLNLQPLRRHGVLKLLQHYGILPADAAVSNEVVRSYPTTLSYRQFLRITDLALWRAHEKHMQTAEAGKLGAADVEKGSPYSFLNELLSKGGRQQGDEGHMRHLTGSVQAGLSAAIVDVVSEMGVSGVFDGLLDTAGVIDAEEAY